MTLTTDTAVLAKEAANFERIAGELQAVLTRVQQIASRLDDHWKGTAADAAQGAMRRFHEAATAQLCQLSDISANVHTASVRYSATDDERAAELTSAMGFGMGGPLPETPKPWEYNLDLKSLVRTRETGVPGGPVSAGSVASIDDGWNELHRCFNCNFLISGAPQAFPSVGDNLPLELRTAGVKVADMPVKVTQIQRGAEAINIEFATLPGHADGVGSTIHFRFAQENGEIHLHIRGFVGPDGPGSESDWYSLLERGGYGALIAPATWQPYIDNLTKHIAQGKHFPTWDGP